MIDVNFVGAVNSLCDTRYRQRRNASAKHICIPVEYSYFMHAGPRDWPSPSDLIENNILGATYYFMSFSMNNCYMSVSNLCAAMYDRSCFVYNTYVKKKKQLDGGYKIFPVHTST